MYEEWKKYRSKISRLVPAVQKFVIGYIDFLTNLQFGKSRQSYEVLFFRYSFAVTVVGIVTIIRLLLRDFLDDRVLFLIYYSAIIASTAYGGFGPGFFSIILSVIAANYYFILPVADRSLSDLSHILRMAIFFIEGLLITTATSSLRLLRLQSKENISMIHKQQDALTQAHKRTSEILHNLTDGYFAISRDWKYLDVNPRGAEMAGFPAEEMIGKDVWELFPDSRNSPFYLVAQQALTEQRHIKYEGRAAHSDTWFESNIYPTPEGITVFSKDVTEQVLSRKALEKSEEHFRTLIEAVEDYAIFALDLNGNITSWNEEVEYILGYSQEEAIGLHIRNLFTAEDQSKGVPEQKLRDVLAKGEVHDEGIRVRKDGGIFHAVTTTTPMRDDKGEIKGFSKIMRDVTEKKEAEETIRYQAYHDALTGLANRDALFERFILAKASALRHNHKLAILFLDLDRFKNINDTLGHEAGDLILREVAERLKACVRVNDLVVRLGGDEFIILLTEINRVKDIINIAEKIQQAFEPVMRVQDHSLHVATSFGISVFQEDGQDLHSLLKNVDVALYRAKEEGRNRFQFYNYRMNLQSTERLMLEQDLRIALQENQLQVAFQPYVSIASGKVLGVEALVRWGHPRLGILSPADFIPIAEETGIILPMGKWILKKVCEQGVLWQNLGMPLVMSVNLSARQFTDPRIVQTMVSILQETKLDPQYLELEITETIAMENISETSNKLAQLKQHGIAIAIDDFGTGYSSLSYLKRFPVHKLKIDKSFLKYAFDDSHDLAIIRAIISMGKSLNLAVCAEGVESQFQMELLSSMECEMAQGYFICKPQFADALTPWLQNHV